MSSLSVRAPVAAPAAPPMIAPVQGLPPVMALPAAPTPAPIAPPLKARSPLVSPQPETNRHNAGIKKMGVSFMVNLFHCGQKLSSNKLPINKSVPRFKVLLEFNKFMERYDVSSVCSSVKI
jgi:hypothetical protein